MMTILLHNSQFSLHLSGRWRDGGLLEVRLGRAARRRILLPRSLWAVAALLAERARDRAAGNGAGQFLTTNELAYLLAHRSDVGGNDTGCAIRFVHRLRRKLAESDAHRLDPASRLTGPQWARQLIESQPFLGYRISLPPQKLTLEIVTDNGPALNGNSH